jgi:hypothetical protein
MTLSHEILAAVVVFLFGAALFTYKNHQIDHYKLLPDSFLVSIPTGCRYCSTKTCFEGMSDEFQLSSFLRQKARHLDETWLVYWRLQITKLRDQQEIAQLDDCLLLCYVLRKVQGLAALWI